ncbi:MAG: endonuclease III [Deltaproteobacteria bacterium]|nr:MAG: endonuclease III [Deltaproteobacteria bacterium]
MSGGKVEKILSFLEKHYPEARIILNYNTPFQLLVATILAAQCTDERVNRVTETFFARYPSPEKLDESPLEEIEGAVKPTGFYRQKAKTLKAVSRALIERHGGEVPDRMEALTDLPGVGRKTASIVLGECFGQDTLPVDTHVLRVSRRLGLAMSKNADKVEEELSSIVPEGKRWKFALTLGWHGRTVCTARSPKCSVCGLEEMCPKIGVKGDKKG